MLSLLLIRIETKRVEKQEKKSVSRCIKQNKLQFSIFFICRTMNLIYLLILSNILLFQSPRSVQTINLSRLCGRFGHACYGGNYF
jgi:hypothetical protein